MRFTQRKRCARLPKHHLNYEREATSQTGLKLRHHTIRPKSFLSLAFSQRSKGPIICDENNN